MRAMHTTGSAVNKAAERSSELYSRALAVSPGGVHSPVRDWMLYVIPNFKGSTFQG